MKKLVLAAVVTLLAMATPSTADAFCGFYVGGAGAKMFNNATQVVLLRDGTTTVLSMQNNYDGPAENFALVVPVPEILQEENVKTLQRSAFDRIDGLSSPRLVEYWEQDPCIPDRPRKQRIVRAAKKRSKAKTGGAGGAKDYGVTVEGEFTVGEYEIVILSAKYSLGLYDWLTDNNYNIPKGAKKVLRPYIAQGMKFFVAKVAIDKVKIDESGKTMLSPLRFHYTSEKFQLPVRLGLLNSKGTQDLVIHILARNQRYEAANYRNVTIPTNIAVRDRTRDEFATFYASLFDRVIRKKRRVVVTEYSWMATKCDPCPAGFPGLTRNHIATFGADVLAGRANTGQGQVMVRGRRSRRRPRWTSGWVLTRLHTRYSKNSGARDIVFKKANAIVGGREIHGKGKRLERGAKKGTVNAFQARYIIRHKWDGPVTCDKPRYGRWGGPPADLRRAGRGIIGAARDIAFVKNRKARLARYVLQSIPGVVRYGKRRTKKKNDKGPEWKGLPAEEGPKGLPAERAP